MNGGEGDVVDDVVVSDDLRPLAEKFNGEPGVLLGGENAADLFPLWGVWADRDEGAQGGGIQGITDLVQDPYAQFRVWVPCNFEQVQNPGGEEIVVVGLHGYLSAEEDGAGVVAVDHQHPSSLVALGVVSHPPPGADLLAQGIGHKILNGVLSAGRGVDSGVGQDV